MVSHVEKCPSRAEGKVPLIGGTLSPSASLALHNGEIVPDSNRGAQ
jgi:hypothetical protein